MEETYDLQTQVIIDTESLPEVCHFCGKDIQFGEPVNFVHDLYAPQPDQYPVQMHYAFHTGSCWLNRSMVIL
jgi:hypothetical protein